MCEAVKTGALIGVGVGPGDPELMTIKAARALIDADVIVLPDSGSQSVVAQIIQQLFEQAPWREWCSWERIADKIMAVSMPMTRNNDELIASHDTAFACITRELDAGNQVAFVTLGDPSFYSTFTPLQKRAVAAGYEVVTVPGVISPCALAARANVALAQKREKIVVIPVLDAGVVEEIGKLGRTEDTNLVLMKVGRHYEEVRAILEDAQRKEGAILGVSVGMSGEIIDAGLQQATKPDSYFATVLVGSQPQGELS